MSTELAMRPDLMVAKYEHEVAMVLPSHVKPEQFMRLAVGALRRDRNLMVAAERNFTSFMACLMDAARLGLEPGTKEYWLIPRKIKGVPTVTGFPGWEGYIELMFRAGAITSVKAELVHYRDTFRFSPSMDRPEHEVDWFGDRGPVIGAYAYAEMVGGGVSKVVVIGPNQIARARESSAGSDRPDSPWTTDYGAMVLKTAMRQLQKWVPTSAEYRREQLRAAAEVANEPIPVAAAVQVPMSAPVVEPDPLPDLPPHMTVDADGVLHDVVDADYEDVPE